MSSADSSRTAWAALIVAAACWGLGTVASKRAVEELPALGLLAIQLASSVIVLAVALRLRPTLRSDAPPSDSSTARALARLGLLNPGLAYLLGLLGLASISASLSVLLWTMEPIMILLLATVFLRERVGPSFVVLSGLAGLGLVLVLYEPGSTGSLQGILLTLTGIACCAAYTILARRWLGEADAAAPIVLTQQTHALAFALLAAVVVGVAGGVVLPAQVSLLGWASAIGSGILYYGVAYWCYLTALRRLPASRAAASFYLIPVFGVGGATFLLGERLEPAQWLGAAIVVFAVMLIIQRPAARRIERPGVRAAT